jgi:hypothetical protein
VGVRSRCRQQEEGFSFGEGKYEGGYEVQLEAAWNGELDLTRPMAFVQFIQIDSLTRPSLASPPV